MANKMTLHLVLSAFLATSAFGLLTNDQKQAVLDAHNVYRSNVAAGSVGNEPGATNMVKLDWDCDLATSSQAWAEGCDFNHPGGNFGENLYATSSSSTSSHTDGVDSWVSEHAYFTFASGTGGTCIAGKMCGHYTQVAWASSTSVGCGYAICQASQLVSSWSGDNAGYLVCRYSPPGNFLNQAPYADGSAATACPSETTASGSLCVQDTETTIASCDNGDGDGGDGDGGDVADGDGGDGADGDGGDVADGDGGDGADGDGGDVADGDGADGADGDGGDVADGDGADGDGEDENGNDGDGVDDDCKGTNNLLRKFLRAV